MKGQAVVGAAAIAGAWDYAFRGTEYQNLSYLMGLSGAIATPTATMKLLEKFGDVTIGGKYGLQQFGVPGYRLNRPGQDAETGRWVETPLN